MPAKWTVEIEIADDWIIDGFRILDGAELSEAISEKFFAGNAREGEIKCKVVQSPTQAQLEAIEHAYDEAQLEYAAHYCG